MSALGVEREQITASHMNAYSSLRAILKAPHTPRVQDNSGTSCKLVNAAGFLPDFLSHRGPGEWNAPSSARVLKRKEIYHPGFLPHGKLFQLIEEITIDTERRCAVARIRVDRRIYRDHMGVFPGVFVAEAIAHAAATFLIDLDLKKPLPLMRLPFAQPELPIKQGQDICLTIQMLQRKRGAPPTRYGFAVGCLTVGGKIHAIGGVVCQLLDPGQERPRDQIVKF